MPRTPPSASGSAPWQPGGGEGGGERGRRGVGGWGEKEKARGERGGGNIMGSEHCGSSAGQAKH